MTNTNQNTNPSNNNDASKTGNPNEAKPGSQQNQGDNKPSTDKPEQQK